MHFFHEQIFLTNLHSVMISRSTETPNSCNVLPFPFDSHTRSGTILQDRLKEHKPSPTQPSSNIRTVPQATHSRNTTKPIRPSTPKTPIKICTRIRAQAIPAIRANMLRVLLRLSNLRLQLRCAGVDELELGELRVEDADDFGELGEG